MSKRRISIQSALKRHIPKGARVLVGVSGGRDSIALLHALLGVHNLLKLQIEVCHVDHGLRPCSKDDASFVERFCSEQGVRLHLHRLVNRPAEGENIEAWARRERYRVFASALQERNLGILLTAHTANDMAETLLMRLIAKKELTSIEESDGRRRVIRPLLDIDRKQIDEYVNTHKLAFVEDPTNVDTNFVRNRVRHELLPLIAQRFDPSIIWILSEQARSLAQDSDALREAAGALIAEIGELKEGDSSWLDNCRIRLQGVHPAVQWRVVQGLCVPRLGFVVGEAKASAILSVIRGEDLKIDIGQGIALVRDSNGLMFVE